MVVDKTYKCEFALKRREFTLFFCPYVPIFFAVWQKMRKFAQGMRKFFLFIIIVASAACIITAQSRCEEGNTKALAKGKTADVETRTKSKTASSKVQSKGKTASVETQPKGKTLSATAKQLAKAGYVNIQDADPSIHVSLMYARADNFTGRVLYGDLREAFLHPKAATALVKAQRRLKQLRPDLSLKVYDAARPMHIQQKMWDAVKNTSKDIYVSNPAHGGGMHNYGLAVDITLCDAKGDTLDMGTKIDYMGRAAHIDAEQQLVASHKISRQALRNRQLLREVMRYAGYRALRTEWWHFNLVSRATAKKYYKAIR